MKLVLTRLTLTFCLVFLTVLTATAAPPKLEPIKEQPLPTEATSNVPLELSLTYTGDPPTKLTLVVLTPDGETVTVPGKASVGDSSGGVPVVWPYKATESGEYRYHFEAQSGDIGSVRYPTSPADDFQFVVANPLMRYIVLGIGLLVCFLLLPFVAYTATRNLNRRGDPTAAVRIALLIGLIAYIALAVGAFSRATYIYWLGWALGGVVVFSILVGLFARRRDV